MKKILILLLLLLVFTSAQLFAHAPSSVDATFDKATGTVTIKVVHSVAKSFVSNPAKHYISKVIVKVNGETVETVEYKKQETVEAQGLAIKLKKQVKKGDKISVRAICNLSGARDKVIVVD